MTTTDDSTAPLCFLVGATASGKKAVALELARRLPFELLSLDSMKVYRGMDRGTDKQAPARFALTNLVEPTVRFSVGDYVRAAGDAVAAIRARGRLPLFVGGTGLYLRALVRGLFEVPPIDPAVRQAVAEQVERDGLPAAHAELSRLDPETAARLHLHDRKRIVRALEVVAQTGESLSSWQRRATRRPIEGRPLLVGIRWQRPALRERIRVRIERMFAAGLVDEVRQLLAAGQLGPVAALAIGYREVIDYLRAHASLGDGQQPALPQDERTRLQQLQERVVSDTTTFMRRQENWFRQFPEIRWVDSPGGAATGRPPTEGDLVARVAAEFERGLAEPAGATHPDRAPPAP
ncbi:MAG: tRNA (adenosine(37)-N6)-dimethylallyltransferase MiaA [Planctomycetes bacterium]|nr:tRNA (adenosine(37)-N6)-dimethylallyltransferase MiaA [Planctomycetota bacterium]